MLDLRQKGQEARKAFTHLAECFQARHSDWNLHPHQSMDESMRRDYDHISGFIYRERDM